MSASVTITIIVSLSSEEVDALKSLELGLPCQFSLISKGLVYRIESGALNLTTLGDQVIRRL